MGTTRLTAARSFATHVVNPLTRTFAGWLPGFGILTHVGRRSGRTYRTPITVFRHGRRYVFALTYGSDVDWVRNVLAADGCLLRARGHEIRLRSPRVFRDPTRRLVPGPVRLVLRAGGVTEFLEATVA